jgi:hypothetical protein
MCIVAPIGQMTDRRASSKTVAVQTGALERSKQLGYINGSQQVVALRFLFLRHYWRTPPG